MNTILEESRKIKIQADTILRESRIVETLSTYGEVKIGGSYALDVMLRPDIDIFVVSPEHNWRKLLDLHSKIMETKYFRELGFINWIDFKPDPSIDNWTPSIRGFYLQPVVPFEKQLWKMDIWLITPEYDKSDETTGHFKKILDKSDESKKLSILEIKAAMRKGKKYVDGVNGRIIYRAVLENGVSTVEAFAEFLKSDLEAHKK